MSMRALVSTTLTLVLVGQASVGMAAGPKIDHQPLSCVPASGNARVVAKASGADTVTSMKVYFKADSTPAEHFVEMRRESDGSYWAILPKTADGTKNVSYRIVAKDSAGAQTVAGPTTVPTTTACSAAARPEDSRYVSNVVVGLTAAGQATVPPGFVCAGIVGKISTSGDLTNADACREGAAAIAAAEASEAAAGSGALSGALVAGAVVGATVLGAVIVNNSGSHSNPVSVSSARPSVPTASGSN